MGKPDQFLIPRCKFLAPREDWPYVKRCEKAARPNGTNCETHKEAEE